MPVSVPPVDGFGVFFLDEIYVAARWHRKYHSSLPVLVGKREVSALDDIHANQRIGSKYIPVGHLYQWNNEPVGQTHTHQINACFPSAVRRVGGCGVNGLQSQLLNNVLANHGA